MGFVRDVFWPNGNVGVNIAPDGTPVAQGWMASEVRDHDATGCDSTDFRTGRWGGLVCTKCRK